MTEGARYMIEAEVTDLPTGAADRPARRSSSFDVEIVSCHALMSLLAEPWHGTSRRVAGRQCPAKINDDH